MIVFEHLGVHFGAFGTFLGAILEPLGSLLVTKAFFGGVLAAGSEKDASVKARRDL